MIDASDLSNLNDSKLTARIADRDESVSHWNESQRCFEELYNRHAKLLLAFLASRVHRSDLDDVHQTIWQRIWQFLPTQFQGGNFRAWLHQIARNHLIDMSRRRRRQADLLDEQREFSDGRTAQPDDNLLETERTQILSRCLERLEAEMYDLVKARLRGESYAEFCSRTQMPTARAHKLFHVAKQQLSTCVEHALQ
ncbi:MAG: sigma-70 family RNA polymerase sigma factor [Planctomycetaceae bacterium]|jgi:RNA polymerase sigma factor (sigma-70 family)|nr:sigma-70 family RNA polymerase sigma factor [Planctomycetaceae bacterium]MBT6153155.1 sigma-70 family RNA polymerase sigma factor [Planctomycetaceae bacterium]MBT6485857.1 sigma-70 family RNA polymerase sigma factor [Planctomycetaceae bacterium]